MKKSSFSLKGFTLIELVTVVVILLILSGIGLVRYSNIPEKGRSAEAYAVLADIAASENGYYVENNGYTDTWANLDRYDEAPVSNNFTYSINTANKYVKATHKAGAGTVDYYMCIKGGATSTSAPTCP